MLKSTIEKLINQALAKGDRTPNRSVPRDARLYTKATFEDGYHIKLSLDRLDDILNYCAECWQNFCIAPCDGKGCEGQYAVYFENTEDGCRFSLIIGVDKDGFLWYKSGFVRDPNRETSASGKKLVFEYFADLIDEALCDYRNNIEELYLSQSAPISRDPCDETRISCEEIAQREDGWL